MPLTSCLLALALATTTPKAQTNYDLTKGNTMFVVPYAHLDTQWRWAYPQVIREYIWNTLNDNFALIEKYPNYVFNFSGSRRYEMMKEYYPEAFLKLKSYIKDGRWFPCGSSVDENDANVPSGESIIRHVLYGNRFFQREFGVHSDEFMLPDCFGFPYALPSILAHCSIKGFSTQKLTWGSAVGIPFPVGVWEGPDGRYVVAALDPGGYGADVTEDLSQNQSWLKRIQTTGKKSGAYVDYHYYGTGDIGGAPSDASADWVEKSIKGTGPIKVVSTRADAMFNALTPDQVKNLPRYNGELLLTQHSAGSITSQAYMKRSNRKNELLADAAEKASVGAMVLAGADYPSKRLYNAWDLLLGSQMHDMLPGTSIPKAYEFCWNDELLAANQFAHVETDAVGAISSLLDTRGEGTPIVVYNPLSVARTDLVEAWVPGTDPVHVEDGAGRPMPTQILERKGDSVRILFYAAVPSASLSTYHVREGSGTQLAPGFSATDRVLESPLLKVTINESGDIASIFDKKANKEVLKAPSRLELVYHNPSAFPAWNMDWQDAKEPPREIVGGPAEIKVIENGPIRSAIQVERRAAGSKFTQIIRLTAGSDTVQVVNEIDWQTRERALKASFPLTTGNPEATYDLQLGAIKRGNNNEKKYEVPQHQWLDLTNREGTYGAAILNDCKFGSDKPDDDTVRLTLLYTPGVRSGYSDQATQDFGRHEITYAIAPHQGTWQAAEVAWKAKRLNQPLRAFIAPKHAGKLGKSFSLVTSSTNQVEIQALKKAEDNNTVIVRLRELTGKPATNVRLTFASRPMKAVEVDGQEHKIGEAEISNRQVVTDVPAFSLKTIAVTFQPPQPAGDTNKALPVEFDTDVASTDKDPTDGAFVPGHAFAAEQLPSSLEIDGVKFPLGSTAKGQKNAITASGQTIQLTPGYTRLHILAAADEDLQAEFKIGNTPMNKTVHAWNGYFGQWDNRLWAQDPGPNFRNYGDWMSGLVPGHVKDAEVAWWASHHHTEKGNTFYEYTYIYKYSFDIPPGAQTFTLPNDPRVKVFSIAETGGAYQEVTPAAPLYDTLADHQPGGSPTITTTGDMNDVTYVSITPPLYWSSGNLRFKTDEGPWEPYTGPIALHEQTRVRAALFDSEGKAMEEVNGIIAVNDTTAPKILQAGAVKALGHAKLVFSEAVVKESAENSDNYTLSSGVKVQAAHLAPDNRTVELVLAEPLPLGKQEKVTVRGVRDLARNANVTNTTVELAEKGAVFALATTDPATSRAFNDVQGLPVKGHDSWTLNFWAKVDKMPEHLTIIAGFGRSVDGRLGTGRYITNFSRGINFWASNRDVGSETQLDLGKWQMLTATYDGATLRLYKNAELIAEDQTELSDDIAQVRVMPLDAWDRKRKFDGEVRDMTIWDLDLSPAAVKKLYEGGKR